MSAPDRLRTLVLASTIAVQLLLLGPSASVANDAARGAGDSVAKSRATIQAMRDVGIAMMSWLTEQEDARQGARDRGTAEEGEDPNTVPVGAFDRISHEDLAKLLVPTYLPALPEHDAWGHAFELYLNRDDLGGRRVFLIRSPGRDGRFDTDDYELGAFAVGQADEDLVWSDGYFVRWPGLRG